MTKGMGYPHGFQESHLSKPECELVSDLLRRFYRAEDDDITNTTDDMRHIRRRINKILKKLGMGEIPEASA